MENAMNNVNNPKKPYIRILVALACIVATVCCAVGLGLVISAAQTEQFIYFDLAAGDVTINGTTYKGYAYKQNSNGNYTNETITGSVTSGMQFYVYQSQGGPTNPDGYFTESNGEKTFTLPTRNPVTCNGQSWGNYITNNNNVNNVITNWETAANAANRTYTSHHISVTGKVNATVVIDNLYSTYHTKNTGRTDGGISFLPQSSDSHLTIKTKGDNRFGNIFYSSYGSSGSDLTFDEFESGSSLTVADFQKNLSANYWDSAIGGSDNTYENSDGIIFKGGTVFAGTTKEDDCTAIGGGGNGYGGIKISGGKVTAVVTSSGAAIGGGIGKSSAGGQANITISGGEVYAYNYSCESRGYTDYSVAYIPAAAIGGGSSGKAVCNSCTVTINGNAYVYAQSVGGTAIGGGSSADNNGGSATVTIGGNAQVTAKSIAGMIGGQDVPAGAAIGGGTGGKAANKNGGNVKLTIEGKATVKTGSIGGGSTTSTNGGKIGSATVNITGGTLQGQIVMAQGSSDHCSFTMTGGKINNSKKTDDFTFLKKDGGAIWMDDAAGTAELSGGTITGCSATNGGAVYMTAGTFTLSGDGTITNCNAINGGAVYMGGGTFTMNGGTVSSCSATDGGGVYLKSGEMTVSGGQLTANAASQNGGGAYLGGGTFTMSNGTLSGNNAQNGGGALVSDGSVTISDGTVEKNTATQNGGAFSITDGNYTMTGGTVTNNAATNGNGGAIYVSSQNDSTVTIRSGSVTDNRAGQSGGALGVVGTNGAHFIVNIGSNTSHANGTDCHAHPDGQSSDEKCPAIQNNTSGVSGGGIYFTGSYDATMNMYCLVERGNTVGDGVSLSNFMKVEGGTLNISTNGDNNTCGNVVINSTVHVTGGKVTLAGSASNPLFNETVTVDIQDEGFFTDQRTNDSSAYTIQYFENFEKGGKKSGQYKLIDVKQNASHTVQAALYSATGYVIEGWTLMKYDNNGKLVEDTSHTALFKAGDAINVNRSYIFYAKWAVVGYTVIFESGVSPYEGSMFPQDFNYDESKALTKNTFINPGYNFDHWVDNADSSKTYTDGATVSGLADTHGATITLVAVWKICEHNDADKYTLSHTDSSVTRTCNCHGYTETASLSSVTTVYNGQPQGITVKYTRDSKNGSSPTNKWNFTVRYTGAANNGTTYNSETAPTNAGNYKGSITTGSITISATITINKADNPNRPAVPEYEVTKTQDEKFNIISITGPTNDSSGFTREYQFSWYEGTDLQTSNWITWDNSPSQQLDITYTNYYVYVRYAETDNYRASDKVQGTTTIYWTGKVTFEFSAGTGLTYRAEKNESQSGITVTLTPSDTSYYIYDLKCDQSADVAEYGLPTIDHTTRVSSEWVIWIHDIKDAQSAVTITINFSGAEKIATVSNSTVKDEVFDDISNKGNNSVTVSRDSAFTSYFKVGNYNHYKDPAVKFSQTLPSGSTVIMIDRADGSYWGYSVLPENNATSILLTAFVRMGTTNEKYTVEKNKTEIQLQFVVDFSDCNSCLTGTDLTVSFDATPVQPEGLSTVPSISSNGGSVTLADAPTFKIETGSPSNEGLSANINYYQFGIAQDGTGISKWKNVRGILKLTLKDNTSLPADTKLKVTIGSSTAIYPLINNGFTVPLPSIGSGSASLTLLSDMLPNKDISVTFDVSLGASATNVGTTPQSEITSAGTVSITYTVTERTKLALQVRINDGDMPKYENNSITPLNYTVTVKNLQTDYKVQATLYRKNEYGKYTDTTQKVDIAIANNSYSGKLTLDSLASDMNNNTGSLSMMLEVKILDANEATVESVPLYFVIIDTRQ